MQFRIRNAKPNLTWKQLEANEASWQIAISSKLSAVSGFKVNGASYLIEANQREKRWIEESSQ